MQKLFPCSKVIMWPMKNHRDHDCKATLITLPHIFSQRCHCKESLIARFMGPTWGPSGADRTQVGPMLVTLLCYLGYLFESLNKNVWISNKISLKYILGDLIHKSSLTQEITGCLTGTMPLPKPMMNQFTNIYTLLGLNELTHCSHSEAPLNSKTVLLFQTYWLILINWLINWYHSDSVRTCHIWLWISTLIKGHLMII